MSELIDRKTFIQAGAAAGALAAMAGCQTTGEAGQETSLIDFRLPAMERVRIGFIGLGERGMAALHRIMLFPGVEAAAICDLRAEAADEAADFLKKWKLPGAAHVYKGTDDAWMGVCDDPEVDAVYIVTPAPLHAKMELRALACGKHVLCEVPGAETIDDCWAIVEAAEKSRRHCLLLENRCFREAETLVFSLCKQGALGELAYAEGAYIHNLTRRNLEDSFRNRPKKAAGRAGADYNSYPTHPLGPICRCFDINRGDRMTNLVSMSAGAFTWPAFAREQFPADAWQNKIRYTGTDMNTTLIRTARGRTIELKFCLSTPRPYTRINLVAGTKGCFQGEPFEVTLSEKSGEGGHAWFDAKKRAAVEEKYRHPLWKKFGDTFKRLGSNFKSTKFFSGHGGVDYLMDLSWIYAFRTGSPMPQDVYDLASWSAVVELSKRSVRSNSGAVDFPDFTRGAWEHRPPQALNDFDPLRVGFDAAATIEKASAWCGAKIA